MLSDSAEIDTYLPVGLRVSSTRSRSEHNISSCYWGGGINTCRPLMEWIDLLLYFSLKLALKAALTDGQHLVTVVTGDTPTRCCMSLHICICQICYVKYMLANTGRIFKIPTNAPVRMSFPLLILANESSQIGSAYRFPNPSERCCGPTHEETSRLIRNLSCRKEVRLSSDWPNEGDR